MDSFSLTIKRFLKTATLATLVSSSLWAQARSPQPPTSKTREANGLKRPITDEVFYFLMTDRFADGDRTNNKAYDKIPVDSKDRKEDIIRHGYQPELEDFYHGGDFLGVVQKLDYLQGLGVTSLWLTPVQKNRATQLGGGPLGATGGYHGYWIQDFTTVDPHWGKEEDFQKLIDEAHRRGIKVFIDVITNHTADMIAYRECGDCAYRSVADFPYATKKNGKELNPGFVYGDPSPANFAKFKDTNYAYSPFIYDPSRKKVPEWLNDMKYYHNRGNSTFSGENSEMGDFYGLDDLFTEHPDVVKGMIDIYADWIKKYKFDGFRIDTVKHVNIEFWQQFVPAMRKAAQEAGIDDFYIFGEVYSSDPTVLSRYIRLGAFDSVLDFSFQSVAKDVFGDGQPAHKLHEAMEQDDLYRIGGDPQKMMSFISNHDIGRLAYFMRQREPNMPDAEAAKRIELAQSYLILARGVPVLYYGDEQGFVGTGGDKGAREDMFPTKVKSYGDIKLVGTSKTTKDDNFDAAHPLYKNLTGLIALRKKEALLKTGDYAAAELEDKKLLAFTRSQWKGQEQLWVVFNTQKESLSLKGLPADAKAVYPANAAKDQLAGLSYAVFRSKAPTTQLTSLSFHNLEEGERVAGLFYAELNLPKHAGYKVTFSQQKAGSQAWTPIYVDTAPPYRAYLDGSTIENGSRIKLRAEVEATQGKAVTVTRDVIVDGRPPKITLNYQNGNARTFAYHIARSGRIVTPSAVQGNVYRFDWPLGEAGQLVVFGTPEDKSHDDWAYDVPFALDYRQHILPNIKAGAGGAPTVTLYVSNTGEVSASAVTAEGKPAAVPAGKRSDKPFGSRELFLRGGMNTWEPKDEVDHEEGYLYRTEVKLSTGLTEFKFGDRNWSADSNFGSPVTLEGLTSSGNSGNLSFEVPQGAAGEYRFDLIVVPADALGRKEGLRFYKVEKD